MRCGHGLDEPGRDELAQRLVLLLNHVLQQEPQAMQRIARLHGQQVSLQWQAMALQLIFTPAGLLDLASTERPASVRVGLRAPSRSNSLWRRTDRKT